MAYVVATGNTGTKDDDDVALVVAGSIFKSSFRPPKSPTFGLYPQEAKCAMKVLNPWLVGLAKVRRPLPRVTRSERHDSLSQGTAIRREPSLHRWDPVPTARS
jgi:hypothetical protein